MEMNARAAQLIADLDLNPHPEGGHYRRMFRSEALVRPDDDRTGRAALTSVYYLLASGEVSRWHRVASDEVWHFYEGAPLVLYRADPNCGELSRVLLGPVAADAQPVSAVPRNHWQAARSTGAYTLVGCTVGPGFDFNDFTLLRDLPEQAERMRNAHPEMAPML